MSIPAFDDFRKDFWGKILTVSELALHEPKQQEAFLSLIRQAMAQALDKFEANLKGKT